MWRNKGSLTSGVAGRVLLNGELGSTLSLVPEYLFMLFFPSSLIFSGFASTLSCQSI